MLYKEVFLVYVFNVWGVMIVAGNTMNLFSKNDQQEINTNYIFKYSLLTVSCVKTNLLNEEALSKELLLKIYSIFLLKNNQIMSKKSLNQNAGLKNGLNISKGEIKHQAVSEALS